MFALFPDPPNDGDNKPLNASPFNVGLTDLVPFLGKPLVMDGELERVLELEFDAASRENASL